MKRWMPLFVTTVLLASAIVALVACDGAKSSPKVKDPEQIVVYSDRGIKFLDPVFKAFEKETGILVDAHLNKGGQLLTRLKADKVECDILLSKDSATMEKARVAGLLQPITGAEMVARVPEKFRGEDNHWLGLTSRMRVVVYNTDKVKAGDIKSVFDLAKPEHKDKVGTVKSDNGSFISGVSTYLADHDEAKVEAFLKGLKANAGDKFVFPKHTPTVAAVAAGQIDMGLVNHYYFYRHKAKDAGAKIDIAYPDQDGKGCAWNVVGVGLTKMAANTEHARKFIAFLLSDKGQKLFAELNYEYPTVAGAKAHTAVKPLAEIKLSAQGIETMHAKRADAVKLIQKLGMK